MAKFSLTYVPSIFSYYRFHENHKTSTGGIKRSHEIMEIINKYSSSEWKSLYETVFPFSQELQELKSTWRGLFFVIFILKYPRLIFGTYRLNDLNIVAHMLC